MVLRLYYVRTKLFDGGRDAQSLNLARKPGYLVFPKLGAEEASKVWEVVTCDVQCGTKASLGDGSICDYPQGITGSW